MNRVYEDLYQNHSKLITNGNTSLKQISLTYDTGSEDNETMKILEVLRKHNVKATFFLTGVFAEKYPELAKKIYREGHQIGNHSYNHPRLTELSHDEIVENIKKGESVIRDIIGVETKPYFREPYGAWNKDVFQAVGDAGYKYSIYWTIDTIDWQLPSVRVIVNRILRNVKNGSIVLMHVDGNNTAKATDIAINNLKVFGYKLVTLNEIII